MLKFYWVFVLMVVPNAHSQIGCEWSIVCLICGWMAVTTENQIKKRIKTEDEIKQKVKKKITKLKQIN